MVNKMVGDKEPSKLIRIIDVGTFLNISNNLIWSYNQCTQELEKLDRMYETSHERIFRKLKLITKAYLSDFNRLVYLSSSGEISDSIEKRLNKLIREFNNDKNLTDALANARTLSLLEKPPAKMGYSQIKPIFDAISTSYKELLDRVTELYEQSMEQQVRAYKRR